MTVIAFSLVSRDGEALVTRVYSEEAMKGGKHQLESILSAFPKLIDAGGSGKGVRCAFSGQQHTFVEAGDVRYLYQPLDDIYLVLITAKSSNILRDVETLRLFSKVVPDYYRPTMGEVLKAGAVKTRTRVPSVRDNCFELIFAFDEIVSHDGLSEDVTPGQVRSYGLEMYSQEERLSMQIKLSQELAANNAMEEKVREFRKRDREKNEREERDKRLWGRDNIDRSHYF